MKDCVALCLALPWGWEPPDQNLEDHFPLLDVRGLTVSMLGLQESKGFHPWQTRVDFCESVFPECVGEGRRCPRGGSPAESP